MNNATLNKIDFEGVMTSSKKRDVGYVLRALMKRRNNMKPNELARESGVSQPTIHRLVNDETVDPRDSTIEPLAAYFGVTIAQLKGIDPIPGIDSNASVIPTIRAKVPLIKWNTIGDLVMKKGIEAEAVQEWLPCPVEISNRAIALKVEGDAMVSPYPGQKSYPSGTVIFVDPDQEITNNKRVVAFLRDSEAPIFRTYIEEAGRRYLMPVNPHFDRIIVDDNVAFLGPVVGSFIPED